MAELEHAALSGELFSPRSPSPSRSTSTSSPQNTDDELGSDLSAPPSPSLPSSTGAAPPASTGPQTGPKGVISDRRARTAADQAQSARQRQELRAAQERQAIVGLTVDEEAEEREREELLKETRDEDARKEREDDASAWEAWRARRREELGQRAGDRGNSGGGSKGLREVGQEGFVGAVERPGWVVVLIYEPDIPRCQALLAEMLHLSLNLPSSSSLPAPVALFRARASNLSFSLLPQVPQVNTSGGYGTFNRADEDEGDDVRQSRGKPDPDVLPTLLVYKDGELEKTWIRVDWDLKGDGLEGLLQRSGVLPQGQRIERKDEADLIEYDQSIDQPASQCDGGGRADRRLL